MVDRVFLAIPNKCFFFFFIATTLSHHVPILQVSMLNKGFGDVGEPKGVSTGTTGSQFLEQYKTAQALAQLAAQHSQTGPPNTAPSSWDTGATSLGYGEATHTVIN